MTVLAWQMIVPSKAPVSPDIPVASLGAPTLGRNYTAHREPILVVEGRHRAALNIDYSLQVNNLKSID